MSDTQASNSQWLAAQIGERRFHVDEVPEWGDYSNPNIRRHQERIMRYWYAALLSIPSKRRVSTTDYGCGPQSLLLETPGDAPAIAVDPLRFTDEDERAYERAGVTRAYVGAEDYSGPKTEEGWMYNCLQHTKDWRAALTNALTHTTRTFRMYEWVNVPTDMLHLHTLRKHELMSVCEAHGFAQIKSTSGDYGRIGYGITEFYASVWMRPT